MRPLFGPRTVVEAVLLVAVPVIALEVGLAWYWIIAAGAVAYGLVLLVEGALWRDGRKERRSDGVVTPEPDPEPPPQPERVPEPPRPEPAPPPLPEPEPVPPPLPEPEPVPPPLPEPEPELPPAATAVSLPASTGPQQWNVRDLEELAREHSGGDPIADEERTFLLTYLRDFAGPDGVLPADFDELVRQSFGALVANR